MRGAFRRFAILVMSFEDGLMRLKSSESWWSSGLGLIGASERGFICLRLRVVTSFIGVNKSKNEKLKEFIREVLKWVWILVEGSMKLDLIYGEYLRI